METTIEAIYENGVFRPTQHVALTEGTHVEVHVPSADEADRWVESLRQMAASGVPIAVPADDARESIYEGDE